MNGAEVLLKTAAAAGIEVCFTNPGTTELPLVEAFDTVKSIRPVLGLFEGGCSGAADGYARMAGKPAMTLFHLGPGLGNAIANLHNAKRAHTPLFNVVGDHATWHRPADAPLTMDIAGLAETVSGWAATAASKSLSRQTAQAIEAADRGCVATLIVPQDVQWQTAASAAICRVKPAQAGVDAESVDRAAGSLRRGEKTVLILGGDALKAGGLKAAARIRAQCGCGLLAEAFPAHMVRGAGYPAVERIPYAPTAALEKLAFYDTVLLAGASKPVAFFGYRNGPSRLLGAHQSVVQLTPNGGDISASLQALADLMDAPFLDPDQAGFVKKGVERPPLPSGALSPKKISAVIAALQPEGAVVVDESVTSGAGYYGMTASVPPFSLLTLTGGAIGQGIPCATGAAIACPDRPVIDFQADGSALYTLQSLWTQARESLNVTTLLCANRRYRILENEIRRAGNRTPGNFTRTLTDLSRPEIDWASLSKGMGVPAASVATAEDLARQLRRGLAEAGPCLIEIQLA